MTGFGQAEGSTSLGTFRVEIRSVNNRFLDIQLRIPKSISILENEIKQTLSAAVSRGSLSVFINRAMEQERETTLTWDRVAVDNYVSILREIGQTYHLEGSVNLSHLLQLGDVIKPVRDEIDEKKLWADLKPLCERALEDFQKSREQEAAFIGRDLKKMLAAISNALALVEKRAPVRVEEYRLELTRRVATLVSRETFDAQRIALEIAIMADKLDISEECTRLAAHIEKFNENIDSNEPVGKRLNFLLQEMNREANTIGSKANDTEIAHLSVELKENIERIREQIQNIE
jgi:uncharacterized protein (TIGR00255 family)